jgi:hypothetical protein
MGSFVRAAAASALLFTTVAPNPAFALVPAPIVPPPIVPAPIVPPPIVPPPIAPAPIAPAPTPAPHPVPNVGGSSAGAGVAVTGGFLGFVGLLVSYDLIRRTTCSGDFLQLGGPGFTQPITPAMTVLPPRRCAPVPVSKRPVVHAKG